MKLRLQVALAALVLAAVFASQWLAADEHRQSTGAMEAAIEEGLQAMTLSNMRSRCAKQRRPPLLKGKAEPTLLDGLYCVHNGLVFVDQPSNRTQRPREWMELRQDAAVVGVEPLQQYLIKDQHGNASQVVFHDHSLGVLITCLWSSVNFYHLLMDGLNAALHWMATDTPLFLPDGNSYQQSEVVLLGDHHHLYIVNRKSLCTTCTDYARVASLPSFTAPVVSDGTDRRVHCFCGGAIFGMNRLERFGRERSAGALQFKLLLNRIKGETAYGDEPHPTSFTRLGYWTAGNLSAPRLLFVDRRRRRIGGAAELQQLAREVGFNVAAVHFEALSPSEQFHLSRYADVLVGIHGMALTYVANMDGTGRFGGDVTRGRAPCKTLIELMHWVNPKKFFIYKEMAAINNVSFRRVLPRDVTFGSSVKNSQLERRLLMKNNFYYWSLSGFDDQVVEYDHTAVRAVLQEAINAVARCHAR